LVSGFPFYGQVQICGNPGRANALGDPAREAPRNSNSSTSFKLRETT
jgi:hypothetical protein